ncbi:xanthine dehydrogenase family protein subunit M [Hyphomicrobium sp. 99]|uniref:FAD binding domain-containing protein n=1 Tax=Hyphomicrobium sp. 99 TaxID=1163419 RepID=UPI0005F81BCA|nr:xanthine dehydrogenase family protein subunit M [Hyphomicrobium sp. 99]
MKAADFIYHRAVSVDDALRLLDDYDGTARILAGGQSLVPMLNMRLLRPAALIDVNGLEELAKIEVRGSETVLGGLVRHVTVETSPLIAERLPLLAKMIRHVADRQVRNRGTIGGSLVQGDPTGEMPLGCLVLGARVCVTSHGNSREIAMRDFYEGSYAAALHADELLVEIIFPRHPTYHAFHELNRRHNDFAVLSIAVVGDQTEGRWSNVRLGLGGVHDTAILVEEAGERLQGTRLEDEDIAAATEAVSRAISPPSDMRASEEYRRHLVSVYVPRVLRELRASAETRAFN